MDFEKTKYHHRVSITKLAAGTKDYKLVTMGSIFGSTRLILDKKVNSRMLNNFHRSLAFRNRILDEPANRIRDLLGGPGRYVGVHARVGDGQFMRHAKENMQRTFQELVVDKLGVDKALLPTLLAAGERRAASYPPPASKDRRTLVESPWSGFDSPVEEGIPSLVEEPARLTRRQAARLAVADRETSPLSSTLSCRGELYNDPALFALNAPLYVATDSSHPLSDPALSLFFANFPCSFILSDFDRKSEVNSGEPVRSLKTMERAVNVNDGVKLGRLLLPFMCVPLPFTP